MVQRDLDLYTYFYAIVGDEISRVADFTRADNKRAYHKRYKNQIGFVACRNGWIEYVWVNDGKGLWDGSNEKSDTKINAQSCGLASVFTQICLMDPKLNGKDKKQKNEAYVEFDKKRNMGYVEKVKEECIQFVGLKMEAKPMTGAYAYFSAAIREKYQQLIIQEKSTKIISIYGIEVAKANYDPKTGNINPCWCNEYNTCKAFDGEWFFCKQ